MLRCVDSSAPSPPDAVDRAIAAFQRRFGVAPAVVARAPGRVNLIGEHVDHSEGLVLPIAIDRDCACAVRPSADGRWRAWSEDLRRMAELPDPAGPGLQPLAHPDDRWANYVLGVLAGFVREGVAVPPMDIAVASDVPLGGGLSSSAALEVAVATAVSDALAAPMFGIPLARMCQEAEHRFAGVPCGMMDQLASALGKAEHALLIDCRSYDIRFVPVPANAAVLVVDSGVRHELGDGRYAQRARETDDAARALGVRTLRDVDENALRGARIDDTLVRRARHVVREIQRTSLAATALRKGDLELFGMLMLQSHQSLRDEFAVSTPELDSIVDEARAIGVAGGAFGARLTGGGFGGSVIVLADAPRADAVGARLAAAFQRRWRRPAPVMRVHPANGASVVPPGRYLFR